MSFVLWGIIAILAAIVVLGIAFLWKFRKKNWEHETDYKAFFWMGLIWVIIGGPVMLIFGNYGISGLFAIGVVFLAVGAGNRDKWDRKKKLTPEQKKVKVLAVAVGLFALVVGLAAFILLM